MERVGEDANRVKNVMRVRPRYFKDTIGDFSIDKEAESDGTVDDGLSEVAEALLASIVDEPFLSISERYDTINVGSRQGNTAKKELVKLGLMREVKIKTRKPGRNPKLLD